jgi:chemotaxis protein histidine kinase CheA
VAGAACLFIGAVCIERALVVSDAPARFFGWLAGMLALTALLGSTAWTWFRREDLVSSAAHLDRAAGLKERLSTGLYCQGMEDPFAQAVVSDAERISRGLSVPHHLPVRVPDSAPYAGVTMVLALLFFWLFPTLDLLGTQEKQQDAKRQDDRVNRAQAVIRPILDPQIRELREKNPELKKELDALEALKDAKLESPADLRREAMKTVDKIGQKLEEKRNSPEMAAAQEFKQMMRRLAAEQKSQSPVGQLSKALASGNLESAQAAIEDIKEALSKEANTPEEKEKAEQLKAELEKLAAKIDQIAKDEKKMKEDLAKAGLNEQQMKNVLEQMKAGNMQAAAQQLAQQGLKQDQVQKLMQQMQKRSSGGNAASQLAQSLANAAAAAQQAGGTPMSAADMQGLTMAGEQLSQMESMEQELNQLASSMGQLQSLKDQLGKSCSACNGTGTKDGKACPSCGGSGMGQGMGQGGMAGNPNAQGGGMGNLGRGQGGIAPNTPGAFGTVRRQAGVNTLPGAIIHTEFTEGEQFKGEVSKEFVETVISAQREVSDALAQEQIPRPYQRSVGEYFKRVRDSLPKDKVEAAEEK